MLTPRIAIYARVSSDRQADDGTIDSQIAALAARVAQDRGQLDPEGRFLDEGYSGATLIRPGLERLRDAVAAGAIDRLYVHSPDRLARRYAYQVLLLDEFGRAGAEVVFLNRPIGASPEDDLLLQVQGMVAEYERAKILERSRRGKRHAAQRGRVNVLSGAPYGYRYVRARDGGGEARYEVVAEEARAVRLMFKSIGHDRLSIGQVCRRLREAGYRTRSGKPAWDRATVWGMLKNPAYAGTAAYGKTRVGPIPPRLRPVRGAGEQPRRACGVYDVPRAEWIGVAVPAIIGAELFAAVQEQLEENRRRSRQGARGGRYLLQGLAVCRPCGYAYYGKAVSPKAAKGHAREYAYYRCCGTDAYRFGGQRVCANRQVRTDLPDAAVWREVERLLEAPGRLAAEYERRLARARDPEAGREDLAALETQIGKLRRGMGRLIDGYVEGVIEKAEFEPRLIGLRERLARLKEQREALLDAAALRATLSLIVGRLEDFARAVQDGLAELDWSGQRDLIRTLVKRVEIGPEDINVVFRVAPMPTASPSGAPTIGSRSGTDSLQGRCRRADAALWSTAVGPMVDPIL
ncbi:MAG TPA: recombinase family protein, partial [Microvirga sp.]|nr:recombinase family protein [Microvirga sp.]